MDKRPHPDPLPRSREGNAFAVFALIALSLVARPLAAQVIDGSRYACRPLVEALRDLQDQGLPVVFGSNLVREGMLVSKVPNATTPRRLLDQLLAPHGLRAQNGAGGRLLVVQSFSGSISAPPWSTSTDASQAPVEGVLPAWVDATSPALTVIDLNNADIATPAALSPGSRYLVLRLTQDTEVPGRAELDPIKKCGLAAGLRRPAPRGRRGGVFERGPSRNGKALAVNGLDAMRGRASLAQRRPQGSGRRGQCSLLDGIELAFNLKELIVEARSRKPGLRVALEAPPEAITRLLAHDLAPYIDAYIGNADIPAGDPTARLWWRAPTADLPLHSLLHGAARGAELVILERPLDASQRTFIERIQATPSVDLERQPTVEGLSADRVRFLYSLETGSYFLAVYVPPGRRQTLAFSLGGRVEAHGLYPENISVPATYFDGRTELKLTGDHPQVLVELRPEWPKVENGVLRVDGEDFVDPYEIVVRNQVFQETEAKKVRSLDVMERRHSVAQNRSARRYTWIHRIIERPGQLTEFHHLGVERNGVPFPEHDLRVGRDFRAEAQVELAPLEIELDRTYAYEYLGEEEVDGRPAWRIGFKPLQKGAFLSGTVWIDQKSHAHLKLTASHAGLSGTVISREVTRYYGWVSDDDQCFWNWSRSEGLSVVESPSSRVALAIDTERYGFDYNRDDIEHQVRQAHASDVPIHVATPPEGHRWLVREKPKQGRRLSRLFQRRRNIGRTGNRKDAPHHDSSSAFPSDLPLRRWPSETSPDGAEPFGGRVLADRDAYTSTREIYLVVRDKCSNTISCSGVGLEFQRTDLFENRAELYFSLYDIQSYAALTYPRLGGSRWVMTASFLNDLSYWDNGILHPGTTDSWAGFGQRRNSLELAFAHPLEEVLRLPPSRGTLRARATVGLTQYSFQDRSEIPGFRLPGALVERRGGLELDFERRKLYARAAYELRLRDDPESWSIDGSEPISDNPRRLTLTVGYSTALPKDRSLGSRVVLQQGWDLDHFSDFFSSFSGVRAPGFQPQRHDFGLGASLSWSGRLTRRLPVTLRLEGAALRNQRYPHEDADQLGVELETFWSTWFRTDLFLRLGYGLYSSIPDQGGDMRTRFIVSRRF